MKKIILILIITLAATTNCHAYTYNEVTLDTNELEIYMKDVFPRIDWEDILEKLTLGDFRTIVSDLSDYFIDSVKELIGYHKEIMYTLFALCIASAVLNHLSADEKYNSGVILSCAISLVLIKFYINIYLIVNDVIINIFNLLKISFPLFVGISTAANKGILISESAFLIFITIFQFLCIRVFLPVVSVCTALSVSDLVDNLNISKISGVLLNFLNWFIGIFASMFVCVIKLTQSASYTTGKIALNGVKYTISRAVPVVGGYVSDSLSAIISAIFVIKNTIGLFMAVILVAISLAPVLYIFLCSAIVKLIAFFFDLFSDATTSKIINSFSVCISELAIIILSTVISFIIGISVMMSVIGG